MQCSICLPKVAIVILNWNGLRDTIECLISLREITYRDYDVFLVDNASQGNDADVLARMFGDCVRLIRNNRNLGFTGGNNVGISDAIANMPDYVLLLSNDVVVDPSFLSELIEAAESDPKAGMAGPKIYYYDQTKRIFSAGARINFWTGNTTSIGAREFDKGQFDSIADVDYISGCAMLVKVEVIRKIGLLNENYFAYREDAEWCVKAKRLGYKILYVPKARVWHKAPIEPRKTGRLPLYYMTRNRFLFAKRNSTNLQFLCSLACFLFTDFIVVNCSLLFLRRDMMLLREFYRAIRDGLHIALREQ